MAGPFNGDDRPQEQPIQYGRNDTGNFTIRAWEGSKDQIAALAGQASQLPNIPYEVTETFGKSRLAIHYPYTVGGLQPSTDAVTLWEFFAQHAEKDVLEAAVESQVIATLSTAEIILIRKKILDPPDVTSGQTDLTIGDFNTADAQAVAAATAAGLPAPFPVGNAINALLVYQLMQAGVRAYPVEVPMLRYSLVTSNQFAVKASLSNVRRIISTSTLESIWQIPSALLFSLPTDVSSNPSFAYGWYQFFPTVQQVAYFKWQIAQEWQYGLWSTLIYGNPL